MFYVQLCSSVGVNDGKNSDPIIVPDMKYCPVGFKSDVGLRRGCLPSGYCDIRWCIFALIAESIFSVFAMKE